MLLICYLLVTHGNEDLILTKIPSIQKSLSQKAAGALETGTV